MINVLLTGAGFTANFGSPLAKDIYNLLFNTPDIQNNEEIRKLFLLDQNIQNANYENIYEQVFNSTLTEDAKAKFNSLLLNTFLTHVDFYAKSPQWVNASGVKDQDHLLENFLIKFICSNNKSIFFTLNQDLFIERQFIRLFPEYQTDNNHIKSKLSGMQLNNNPVRNLRRLGVSDTITTRNIHTPIEGELQQHIKETNREDSEKLFDTWLNNNEPYTYYLKLHGSLDYYYNGLPLFITGESKTGRIASCPLTQFYSDSFQTVLKDNECNLIIIGYGFQDSHINKVISDFLSKSSGNDEIHIVDKIDLQTFMKKIDGKIDSCNLKNKLKGYYPSGLDARTLASFIEPNLLSL